MRLHNIYLKMKHTNESKIKAFVTRLFKKIEQGEPFTISFQGEKTYISQGRIDSLKEKHGGFLLPLIGKVMSFIKGGNGFETKGGILPLAALLPLIFGGIAAAGGTAGGIASAVKAASDKAKNDLELEEQRRHNEAIEKSLGSTGGGIFLNLYKGKALKEVLTPVINKIDDVEQEGKKQIKRVVKSLTPFFKIHEAKNGSGIFLQPH